MSTLIDTLSFQPAAVPAMENVDHSFVLRGSCTDRPGIVAAISDALFTGGFNILDAQQFDDALTGRFFFRSVFKAAEPRDLDAVRAMLAPVLERIGMEGTVTAQSQPRKVMLLVSKFDHCLADLLYRWHTGELRMNPVGIISNHPRETYAHFGFGNIPFHHLPVTRDTKAAQEAEIWRLVQESGAELVVLARYMQILSDDLSRKLSGNCINIHHSFLPGFKGAKPYHQAHGRGVKLIGATAHYVTEDLDEGPIIEQDVERISHRDSPEQLVAKGRDIERRVLARAVRYHLEDRVLLNGTTTVVFPE